ncbi:MAG: helix-turn-helix domain-containing protein [Candidatus Marinimicrobia bacterium]|nr:helix-turn-helix domain-containing protein [Candidatus Neomarinimicrobiota bacterium]
MTKALEIINSIMDTKGFRRKRDVAEYFGVSPQALSIWISKDDIPAKHILKFTREENQYHASQAAKEQTQDETQAVINYLMRENVALKKELESLKSTKTQHQKNSKKGHLIDKIVSESLLISGRASDGMITSIDGKWFELMGYNKDQLLGHRYDREDLIHPEEFEKTKKHQETIRQSEGIRETKFSTIQRWKHGITGKYVLLSMVWYVDVEKDLVDVVCKPIDTFLGQENIIN